jgi:hypothetical protein
VLLVETGRLVVVVLSDGLAHVGAGLDPVHTRTELLTGQRLIIGAGALQAIRNDGSVPAVALVVTIIPVEAATPMLGPGEPPLRGTT